MLADWPPDTVPKEAYGLLMAALDRADDDATRAVFERALRKFAQ